MWRSTRLDFRSGTIQFIYSMLPLGSVIRKHSIDFHCYTDDTQLYMSVSPEDFSSTDKLIDCVSNLNTWMDHKFLQRNKDKTEVFIVGVKAQTKNFNCN